MISTSVCGCTLTTLTDISMDPSKSFTHSRAKELQDLQTMFSRKGALEKLKGYQKKH